MTWTRAVPAPGPRSGEWKRLPCRPFSPMELLEAVAQYPTWVPGIAEDSGIEKEEVLLRPKEVRSSICGSLSAHLDKLHAHVHQQPCSKESALTTRSERLFK